MDDPTGVRNERVRAGSRRAGALRRQPGLCTLGIVLLLPGLLAGTARAHTWEAVMQGGFGSRFNWEVASLIEFEGMLYAGTTNTTESMGSEGCEIWRSPDGSQWSPVLQGGFGNPNNYSVYPMIVFQEQLYASLFNPVDGAVILRSADGSTWEPVVENGLDSPANVHAHAFALFQDALYAGTVNVLGGCQVWRTRNGIDWEVVSEGGFGSSSNVSIPSLAVHRNRLYAGTWNFNGAELWRSPDGERWSRLAADGLLDPANISISTMIAWEDELLAGLSFNAAGCMLAGSSDGRDWRPLIADGFGTPANQGLFRLLTHAGELHATTYNPFEGLEVWTLVPEVDAWFPLARDGVVSPANFESYSSATFQDALYIGTANTTTGAEILRTRAEEDLLLLLQAEQTVFRPGDRFSLELRYVNPGPTVIGERVIMLDLGPEYSPRYYFAPHWQPELETQTIVANQGESGAIPVLEFDVPDVPDLGPFTIYAALLDPGMTRIIGHLERFRFVFQGS